MLEFIKPDARLFRFLSPASNYFERTLEDIVVHNRIYLNTPSNFNDPLDLAPVIQSDLTEAQLRRDFDRLMNNLWSPTRSADEILKLQKIRDRGVNSLDWKKFAENMNAAAAVTAVKLKDETGVCCFTEEIEKLPLWAHYAQNHHGICLEFRRNSKNSILRLAAKVKYSERRPIVRLSVIHDELERGSFNSTDWNEYIIAQFFTKDSDWAYEREWRIALAEKARESFNFDKDELVQIHLGISCLPATESIIQRVVKKSGREIVIGKMRLHDSLYKVVPI